jgi:hypothetical protein
MQMHRPAPSLLGERLRRPVLARRRVLGLCTLGVGCLAMVVASAAALGGVRPATLFAQNQAVTIAVGVSDTFTGASGTNLTAHTSDTGQTWTQSAGSFTLTGSAGTKSGTNSAISAAWLTTGLTAGSYTASVTMSQPNNPACCGGLYLNVDATGASGISVIWYDDTGGRIVIGKRNGATITALQTFTGVGLPAVNLAMPLQVTYLAGTYTVRFMGSLVGSYTLSAPDLATYGGSTRSGIIVDKNNKIVLSAFQVGP